MNNTLLAFLLTFIAGFSTMIGVLVIFIKKKNYDKIIAIRLNTTKKLKHINDDINISTGIISIT